MPPLPPGPEKTRKSSSGGRMSYETWSETSLLSSHPSHPSRWPHQPPCPPGTGLNIPLRTCCALSPGPRSLNGWPGHVSQVSTQRSSYRGCLWPPWSHRHAPAPSHGPRLPPGLLSPPGRGARTSLAGLPGACFPAWSISSMGFCLGHCGIPRAQNRARHDVHTHI